ncbi:MAG: UDP-3-O-(3-hydroxymyristoyl)glucosamine N-acyltransferase, partial [Myxococcota bacterium]
MELRELAKALGGLSVEGDPAFDVLGVSSLEDGGATDLGFVRDDKYAATLGGRKIGALIAPDGVEVGGRPVVRSANPSLDFARATALLHPPLHSEPGVHERAFVAESASVAATASVGPLASVGAGSCIGERSVVHPSVAIGADVEIGEDCVLHLGCVVREGARIGDRVTLQPGCVIGGDGFGYEFDEKGEHAKVPQVGNVVIEDDVEVGANSTIDRARLGSTRIGRGTKIDNLVMVAHNVEIGAHSVLISQVGIAGSTKIGSRTFFMAQSGAGGHLSIGEGVFVGARGGVIEDLDAGSRVWGFPALPERTWHRSQSIFG